MNILKSSLKLSILKRVMEVCNINIVNPKTLENYNRCWYRCPDHINTVCAEAYRQTCKTHVVDADDFLSALTANLETELVDETARGYAQEVNNALELDLPKCMETATDALRLVRETGTTNPKILRAVEIAEQVIRSTTTLCEAGGVVDEVWRSVINNCFTFAHRL
jgi:hypothetical protein